MRSAPALILALLAAPALAQGIGAGPGHVPARSIYVVDGVEHHEFPEGRNA